MSTLRLGIIGNCQISALVDERAQIVWSCMSRFDADPVFCRLLNGEADDGVFAVDLIDFARSEQRYEANTAILQTDLTDSQGGVVRVIDFAPRYRQEGRYYRPVALVRIVTRLAGNPRIRVRLQPRFNYGADAPVVTHGSNHIRYVGSDQTLRLTTNGSVTSILEGRAFSLTDSVSFFLGPDESFQGSVATGCAADLQATRDYWRDFVRGLSIPFEWQSAVIRAAITLKLSAYADTGAVVAAMTTSVPEAPDSGRNWDYRYCWLRDAYFVVQALNRLGATRTMTGFIRYIVDVAENDDVDHLQPVYSISGESRLTESIVEALPGYRGMGPVRLGNDAYRQIQHDVYGSVIVAATRLFCDVRLQAEGNAHLFERLEALGHAALANFDQPDAGLWEYRGRSDVHTFSSVMCWAAADRLSRIAQWLPRPERAKFWRTEADRLRADIEAAAWNESLDSFVDNRGGERLDASLLLLQQIGFLDAEDPRFRSTVEAVEHALRRGPHMMRYAVPDDFGTPETAFNICTFWYIDALATLGRHAEAKELFENMLGSRNALGLMSEDITFDGNELWGNFPQTYSMVGLINSALKLSRSWEDAF